MVMARFCRLLSLDCGVPAAPGGASCAQSFESSAFSFSISCLMSASRGRDDLPGDLAHGLLGDLSHYRWAIFSTISTGTASRRRLGCGRLRLGGRHGLREVTEALLRSGSRRRSGHGIAGSSGDRERGRELA